MLLNDFFTITDTESSASEIWAELLINANHKIFEGHFPNQPVVPGVCMMQMVKEIVEKVLEKETNLLRADEMKFLAIIDPQVNNRIQATIAYVINEDEQIKVTGLLYKDELVHFKFKGLFTFQVPHS